MDPTRQDETGGGRDRATPDGPGRLNDREGDRGFAPITPNPFIVGNPIRDRSMFFGREAEFELVRRRFHPPAQGGLLVFCGERRSGKTSILFQILDGRLGPQFLPVLVDMQSMAVENERDFLRYIALEVLRTLDDEQWCLAPPDFGSESSPSSAFLRFMGDLCRAFPGKTPILLFDEYELLGNKIEAGILTEDILHMMANLMEAHSVCLVFTGSQHIEQRKQPYWRILGKSQYRVISYLQREDAIKLMRLPVEGLVRYEDGAVEQILRLTSGQPFYTQAICQSLVDLVNENRAREIDLSMVAQVATEIVENPFPQMIFRWDGLERDEKIMLSLLAERLNSPDDYAGTEDCLETLKLGHYTLTLSKARVASALENLFKNDFLLKDSETVPGYAFRMDLWRLWVRRMHSLWQVLREEGMPVARRPEPRIWRRPVAWAALVAASLVLVVGLTWRRSPPHDPNAATPAIPASAEVTLQVFPSEAAIELDRNRVAVGSYQGSIRSGESHRFRLSAPGYRETTLVLTPAAGESLTPRVSLCPERGGLVIRTDPPGAEIRVDGVKRGRSPVTVACLEAPVLHLVEASMAGRTAASGRFPVSAESVSVVTLRLNKPMAGLSISTTPPGAEILIDGGSRGKSPLLLAELPAGPARVAARLSGYRPADTALVLREGAQELRFVLRAEPPGAISIRGDRPGTVYIDGAIVKVNVENTGLLEAPAGLHRIQIVLLSGGSIDDTVRVNPAECAVYDYVKGRVTRRSLIGGRGE